ncbi:MAG TPA: hypothetical protein VER55_00465, partial [Ardenticatenaceae bacterium]|nr:hypothetical protein [Ardenticatenaceae bacterium]
MGLLAVTVLVFGVALWLGLYLIGRDPRSPRLLLTGLGLGSYALGLGLDVLQSASPPLALAPLLARLRWLLLFLPALCWFGTVVQLLPPEERLRGALWRVWAYGLLPLATALALFGPLARPASATSGTGGAAPLAYLLLSLLVLLPLLVALGFLWRAVRATELKNPRGVALASTLFFALGMGLLLVPLDTFPRVWLLLAIGGDLLLLGIAVAVLDAFDQGESLLPDFVRSLDASLIAALLFGGQVVLATFLGAGTSFPMLALLLATVATAIATQVFADRIEALVDAFALRRYRRAREVRAELRAAASAVPRTADILDLQALDEAEF